METLAIVVIAYNREKSLVRLLDSLTNAYYPEDIDVPLIISVDKSDNDAVGKIAKDYVWEHGDKTVQLHEENLGLRKHVLLCGDIVNQYDGIIVLEDDLFVSPSFYMYAIEALDYARGEKRIGGISLYNHCMNVHVREPFLAIDDGYDNYYFQFASSWGQAYRREQWEAFREWYKENEDKPVEAANVPANVSSWSDKSWLKYYIKYLIDTDRYFLYPRISYTTNFSDEGTHATEGGNDLQVPLAGMRKYRQFDFHFSSLEESRAVYDAFFENMRLGNRFPEATDGKVTVDLYGYKAEEIYDRYVLSCKPLPYRILQSYGRCLRPIDANIDFKIEGKDFFLYDKEKSGAAPKVELVSKHLYNYRAIKAREMREIIKYRFISATPFGKKKVSVKKVNSRKAVKEATETTNTTTQTKEQENN